MSNFPVSVAVPARTGRGDAWSPPAASSDVPALMDADVILPHGSRNQLLPGPGSGGFDGLQFGLASEAGGPGHDSSALAWRTSRHCGHGRHPSRGTGCSSCPTLRPGGLWSAARPAVAVIAGRCLFMLTR